MLFVYMCLLLYTLVESTDLAVTYHHQILILRNVDYSNSSTTKLSIKYLDINEVTYPVGLAYNAASEKLFVADLRDKSADIFTVPISGNNVDSKLIVAKYGDSAIESIVYDSRLQKLYWVDPLKNSIYATGVPNYGETFPLVVKHHEGLKPRAIALDSCNRTLYWSDRSHDLPSLTKYNLVTGETALIKDPENETFYQALTYDQHSNELWWAETSSDLSKNSSCKLVFLKEESRHIYASLDNCYPFALALDQKFVYWTDWARGGVMRLSRKNPSDLVKLVDTPAFNSSNLDYHGAYGMINLNYTQKECPQGQNVSTTTKEPSKSVDHSNVSPEKPVIDNVPAAVATNLEVSNNAMNPSSANNNEQLSKTSSETISSIDAKEVKPAINQSEDSIYLHALNSCDTSFSGLKKLYHSLHYINLALSLFCFVLILITFALLLKLRASHKVFIDVLETLRRSFYSNNQPQLPTRKPKKFGSKLKPSLPASDDGVHIDIEDCCQMTLCERPCFTSINREGKSYIASTFLRNYDDKAGLLDEYA